MRFITRLGESFDRMQAMSVQCGLDLPAAVASGALNGSKLRDSAFHCFNCKMSEACGQVLASNAELKAAPDYCANRALFAQLPRLN